jgi:hypothetical protein
MVIRLVGHEREPEQVPWSIEQVVSLAKEAALRDGYHAPTVIVDGDNGTVLVQISELGNTFEEREYQMFQLGFSLADMKTVNNLRQVFFITEGWMSTRTPDQAAFYKPSQDPHRKEVLLISHRNIQTSQSQLNVWEMIRDKNRKVIDLKVFGQGTEEAETPLLEAFVGGFTLGSIHT